jgi:hypothetical protein
MDKSTDDIVKFRDFIRNGSISSPILQEGFLTEIEVLNKFGDYYN